MAELSTFEKYIFLLEELKNRADNTLDAYDEHLQKSLGLKPKQIDRLLTEISNRFGNIVKQKNGKKNVYKLLKPTNIFLEAFKNSNEIEWLFHMAIEGDPEIFKELEEYTNQNKDVYLFKSTPFEDIKTLRTKDIFNKLRLAVEAREYRKIKFLHDENIYDNLKCLKLVFMDGNWYLAFVDNEDRLRFGRISFIEKVEFASKPSQFQPSSVKEHMRFLENVQNSMTLFGVPKKIAKIKALPKIARYFEKDMKKFLSSQKFLKKEDDGSIIFTLEYTQELEILPFIQKWLPDLIILEPKELRETYKKKLLKALENHK